MVIISVINTFWNVEKNNDKQKMERHVPKAQKQIRHEFNNFATHYHMLLIVNKSTPNTLKQTNHNYFTKLLHKFFCWAVNRTRMGIFPRIS